MREQDLLALLEVHAPTRREWGAIAVEAARRAGLEEPELTDLRRNLALARASDRGDRG